MSKKPKRDYVKDGFVLKEKLGSGSFSTVHKAFDKARNINVAIKCINKAAITKEGADRIIREIEILKMMQHPHVVDMLDFHWDDKYVYIVLEYCDGGDLSKYIKKNQKFPESICQVFMKHLIDGLMYLRSKGVYHYDLKPHNILINKRPELTLKISDFGLAVLADPNLEVKPGFGPRGTPLYMAPEVLLCESYDPSIVDLWSLGVILYECLHGKLPLPYKNVEDLVKAMQAWKPIKVDSKLSTNCKSLLQLLLSYDPKARITFDQLMIHPFLNYEYCPATEETFRKAVITERKAVKLDYNQEYHRAIYKYCESFKYLVPIVTEWDNQSTKVAVLNKMRECASRIEELFGILFTAKLHYSMIGRDFKEKSKKRNKRRNRRISRKTKKKTYVAPSLRIFSKSFKHPKLNDEMVEKYDLEDIDEEFEEESESEWEEEEEEEEEFGEGEEEMEEIEDLFMYEDRYKRKKKGKKPVEDEEVLSQPDRMDSASSSCTDELDVFARKYRTPTHLSSENVAALKTMARATPKMYDGLDVGYAAQMYLYDGNYEAALDKFMIALSILVPLLREEGPGRRRILLTVQVKEFLNLAESVKTLISANKEIQNVELKSKEPTPSVEEFCKIQ